MFPTRLLTTAAVATLLAGSAFAQTPAVPAAPAVAATVPAAPAAPAYAPIVAAGDVVDTLKAAGQFTVLLKATDATNLTAFLKARPAVTLFAPNDAAFAALPAGTVARLLTPAGRPELQKLLLYHMVNTKVPLADFKGAVRQAPTLAQVPVELNGGDMLMVNDAPILQADVNATNGVIFVVGKVLSPNNPPAPMAVDAAPTPPVAK